MSLSGIAIAIGVLVDAAIVMTENVIRHCEQAERDESSGPEPPTQPSPNAARSGDVIRDAAQQVGRPIFFAMAIIILAFVPVFALTGQEGKLFHPLAFTKTFAMIGSTLLAVTIVPVLCTCARARAVSCRERTTGVMRLLAADSIDPALESGRLRPCVEHRARFGCRAVRCSAAARRCLPTRHGQRIHAAAQRRQPALHAGAAAEHVAHGSQAHHVLAGQVIKQVPEVAVRRRQARPRRNRHRPRARRDDRNHHHAQAASPSGVRA